MSDGSRLYQQRLHPTVRAWQLQPHDYEDWCSAIEWVVKNGGMAGAIDDPDGFVIFVESEGAVRRLVAPGDAIMLVNSGDGVKRFDVMRHGIFEHAYEEVRS